jgi:RNA polymerase sigma factor (sigma-70 family)
MSEDSLFRNLIRRAREGDEQAEVELVRMYEPEIRRVVRARLRDPAMRSLLDSTDICQSVLASFFARIVAGKYRLETPDDVRNLLRKMAVNKLINQILRANAAKRTPKDRKVALPENANVADPGPTPSKIVSDRELARKISAHLSDEERRIVELHNQGHSWQEVADQLGDSADALRMRYARIIARVRRAMGQPE